MLAGQVALGARMPRPRRGRRGPHGSKPMVPFWGFRCTTDFRTYVSGDWDVGWDLEPR